MTPSDNRDAYISQKSIIFSVHSFSSALNVLICYVLFLLSIHHFPNAGYKLHGGYL